MPKYNRDAPPRPKVIPLPRVHEREYQDALEAYERRAARVEKVKGAARVIGVAMLVLMVVALFIARLVAMTDCHTTEVFDSNHRPVRLKVCADGRSTIEREEK